MHHVKCEQRGHAVKGKAFPELGAAQPAEACGMAEKDLVVFCRLRRHYSLVSKELGRDPIGEGACRASGGAD